MNAAPWSVQGPSDIDGGSRATVAEKGWREG